MNKLLKAVICGSLSVALLAGCKASTPNPEPGTSAPSETQKPPVTLNVLTNRTDVVNTLLKDWATTYKDKTGVTINWEALKDYENDVKIRLNSNNYGDALFIPAAVKKEEYKKYFEALGKATDPDLKDFYFVKAGGKNVKDEATGEYTVYGLSTSFGFDGMIYNKAAFKTAGVDKAPTTTAELYAAAEKLAKANIIPLATNYKDKWPLGQYDGWLKTIAKDYLAEENLYKETAPFDTGKSYRKITDMMFEFVSKKWVEKDLATTNWEQSKVDLATGKIAMAVLGSWAIPQIQEVATKNNKPADDIGYMACPLTDDGKVASSIGPDVFYGVSAKSTHKAEARQFILDYVSSDLIDKLGYIIPKVGAKSANATVQGFLDSGVTLIQPAESTDQTAAEKKDKIKDAAQIDFYGGVYMQNIINASKKGKAAYEAEIKKLNDKWGDAKKKLGY